MAEIFVNYRSGDGQAAGRLNDQLETIFDTFIDEKMESGDSISAEILEALRDTRVFLAVLGKEWMERKNLKRLFSEKDWVRRELLEVHRKKLNVHVPPYIVPVFVDPAVKMPKEEQLPAVLAWFADQKGIPLFHRDWDTQFEQLVQSIRSLLGVPRTAVRAAGGMPADMPYLCDRQEQEYDLSKLTADIRQTRSLVCILHGHKWEAHSKFLARLRQLRILDRMLEAGEVGVGHEPLEWNSALARSKKFAEMLRYGIKISVLKNPRATDADVHALLRNAGGPLVMSLQVTGMDIKECGATTLRDLVAAWNDLLAALMCIPASVVIFWINVAYDEVSQVSQAMEGLPLLAALGPVTEGHIQTWLNRSEVEAHTVGRATQILNLAQDARFFIKPGELHMQRFADAVTTLVQG